MTPVLNSARLLLCLEPDAAAILLRQEKTASLRKGDVVTVCDCGGGPVDISTHRVVENGALKELLSGTGLFAESTFVDERSFAHLGRKVGADISPDVCQGLVATRMAIQKEWESVK